MTTAAELADRLVGQLPAEVPDLDRFATAAQLADCEARVAAAQVLYLTGDSRAAIASLGYPQTPHGQTVLLALLASFASASAAVSAAVGDDPTRGRMAVLTLQERAAEYRAAAESLAAAAEAENGKGNHPGHPPVGP